MAIYTYQSESGETMWKVYVSVKSKLNRSVRSQRKSSGLKTQKEAEKEESKLIRECEREVQEKESQGQTWGAVVKEFGESLQSSEEPLHLTTQMDYVSALKKHTLSWWHQAAATITKANVREVINSLKENGASVSHQRRMRVIMNRVFSFGMENGLIRGMQISPTVGIQLGKETEKKPEILTIAEIRKLLESAKQLGDVWYPVWSLALMTGMRSGELYALTWADIDWENNMISVNKSWSGRLKVIKTTKSGYWRSVPISSELRSFLLDLKSKAGDRTKVLEIPWKWTAGMQAEELRKFCIGMKIPSIRFHALRACFATQLIRNGVPPIQIQKICGWRDLKTMQRYIRIAGIEINGATEALKVLSNAELAGKTDDFVNAS